MIDTEPPSQLYSLFSLFRFFFANPILQSTGPDGTPALKSIKRPHHDVLDGPFSEFDTQGGTQAKTRTQTSTHTDPDGTVTTEKTTHYTETTTERNTTVNTTETQLPVDPGDRREPTQYPIDAKVEVKPQPPAMYQPQQYEQQPQQYKQTTIDAKLHMKPEQRLETPPPKPPHTIPYGTNAHDEQLRGGVPAKPTSPLAVPGDVPTQEVTVSMNQAKVEESSIAPQTKVQEESIAPMVVKIEESAPMMDLQFRMNTLDDPNRQGSPKKYASPSPNESIQTGSPDFVMPPMPNGGIQTPSPKNSPKKIVMEETVMSVKVKVEESAPVFQQQMQQLEEAPASSPHGRIVMEEPVMSVKVKVEESAPVFQQQMQQLEKAPTSSPPQIVLEEPFMAAKVKVEESEPVQLQQQLQQLESPPESSPQGTPTPTNEPGTPTFSGADNKLQPGQGPPGVMYPTFSDRHRKAGPAKVPDDTTNPGYKTLYDNKKQRASTGR